VFYLKRQACQISASSIGRNGYSSGVTDTLDVAASSVSPLDRSSKRRSRAARRVCVCVRQK